MYRHALPPGFVLKKDKKKEEKEDEISLEDLIEREVTITRFFVWGCVFVLGVSFFFLEGASVFSNPKETTLYCEFLMFTTWGQ